MDLYRLHTCFALQHYAAYNVVYAVYKAFACVAVGYVFRRFVIPSNLLFIGEFLGEHKPAPSAFDDVELLACGKLVNAGKAFFDGFALA